MTIQTNMELHNPGPVSFHIEPLVRVTTPLAARKAADSGRVSMITDKDCQTRIRAVALETYLFEERTSIWHKNICGERAGSNLLYTYICQIHGHIGEGSLYQQDVLPLKPTTIAPPSCHFPNHQVRPCCLPVLDSRCLVNLAFFDCLFYVTVAKIRELHRELSDRLRHGLIAPEAILCQVDPQPNLRSWPCSVKQYLARLNYLWSVLVDPQVIATLDVALRLRNLGHWSIVLGEDRNPAVSAKDCRLRRAELMQQKPRCVLKNEQFLQAPGLMDVFEDSMSSAMICMLVDEIHTKAMQERGAFYDYISKRIETVHQEIKLSGQSKGEQQPVLESKACVDKDNLSAEKPPRKQPDHHHSVICPSSVDAVTYRRDSCRETEHEPESHNYLTEESARAERTRSPEHDHEPLPKPRSCRDRNEASKIQSIVSSNTTRGMSTKPIRRQRGPKQIYALGLYMTRFGLGNTRPAENTTKKQQSNSSCSLSSGTYQGRLHEDSLLQKVAPRTPVENPSHGSENMNLSDSDHINPTTTKIDIQGRAGMEHKLNMVSRAANTGTWSLPTPTGTWTISKDELYALLPEIPTYAVPARTRGATSDSGRRNPSLKWLRLGRRAIV